MTSKFKDGDKVVVTYIDEGDEKYYNVGSVGVVEDVGCDSKICDVLFEDGNLWSVTTKQIELYKEEKETDPAKIAPLLWNAYKDILNEEDLANLKDVIVNQLDECDFEDHDSLQGAFKWSRTSQGWNYWRDICAAIELNTYNKPMSVALENGVEPSNFTSATDFLRKAASLQDSRAAEYDQEGGERSAGKIAEAFNAITGHNLTENDVWMLLVVLKQVRFYNNPANKHRDSVEDLVSYAALFAESVFRDNTDEA